MFCVVVSRYAPEKDEPKSGAATSNRTSLVVPVRDIWGAGIYVTPANPSPTQRQEIRSVMQMRYIRVIMVIYWAVGVIFLHEAIVPVFVRVSQSVASPLSRMRRSVTESW
jgi:hypothetical protein